MLLVTTSKALVTTSDALVPSSFLCFKRVDTFLTPSHACHKNLQSSATRGYGLPPDKKRPRQATQKLPPPLRLPPPGKKGAPKQVLSPALKYGVPYLSKQLQDFLQILFSYPLSSAMSVSPSPTAFCSPSGPHSALRVLRTRCPGFPLIGRRRFTLPPEALIMLMMHYLPSIASLASQHTRKPLIFSPLFFALPWSGSGSASPNLPTSFAPLHSSSGFREIG